MTASTRWAIGDRQPFISKRIFRIALEFDVVRPSGIDEAVDAVEGGGIPVAGGTYLMPRIHLRMVRPSVLVDLSGLRGDMGYVAVDGDYLRIGALATISDLMRARIPGGMESLRAAASKFGSPQIREMATVGGNLATASAHADLITVFEALDARVKLRGRRGERVVKLGKLYRAGGLELRPGELLSEIFVEMPRGDHRTSFEKIGRRASNCPAVVNAAVYMEMDPSSGRVVDVRIATNAIGPGVPGRAKAAESELRGRKFTDDSLSNAMSALDGELKPGDDFMASASYRRMAAKSIIAGLLRRSAEEIAGGAA